MRTLLLASLAAAIGLAQPPRPPAGGPIKPGFKETIKASIYVDNWCMVYINGKLTMVDSIEFLPHNVISANILPVYPMTIAVLAKDNADPKTGLEYGDHIGDAGFILKFSDGATTSAKWKAKSFFRGPLNGDIRNPQVLHTPIPANWYAPEFDDSSWSFATEYTEERVKPDGDYVPSDFAGAKFIWTEDIDLDNTVIFRYTVPKPANWTKTWDADGDLDNTKLCNDLSLCQIAVQGDLPNATGEAAPRILTANGSGLAAANVFRVGLGGLPRFESLSAEPLDLGPGSDKLYLTVYGTGFRGGMTATIGGVDAAVSHGGAHPQVPGLDQVNIQIPRSLAGRGKVDLMIMTNGHRSNPVHLTIK